MRTITNDYPRALVETNVFIVCVAARENFSEEWTGNSFRCHRGHHRRVCSRWVESLRHAVADWEASFDSRSQISRSKRETGILSVPFGRPAQIGILPSFGM